MEFMTVNEYAGHIKASVSKVRDMCHKQELPCLKLGLKWVIAVELADEYIYTRMVNKTPQNAPKCVKKHFRPKVSYNTDDFEVGLRRLKMGG